MFRAILRIPLVLLLLLSLSLVFALPAAAFGPGDLDTSFDTDGMVTTDFGGHEWGQSVAIYSSGPNIGKIVVAGYAYVVVGANYDFALARYNANGTLDTTFGTGGRVTTDFGSPVDYGYSVAIQSDGKIVVAGGTYVSTYDFALARYNANGTLDSSFGAGGLVTTNFGGPGFAVDTGYSVAIQGDGKIVVAGFSGLTLTDGDFALARYNADGTLDDTFGPGGLVITGFGSD